MRENSNHQSYFKGLNAEVKAGRFLQSLYYNILCHRYKSPYGEIDLVCIKDDILVAVEVKRRQTIDEGCESITHKQQERIKNALQWFIVNHPEYQEYECRFDVVVLTAQEVHHLPSAWIDMEESFFHEF